jgi:L-aspartate oxidase
MTNMGYNVPEQKIPISPAFHYSMGGIKTDLHGRVHTIKNIYAVGECAHTGVHGANRLASNSLLEGLVFSARVVEEITKSIFEPHVQHLFPETEEVLIQENDKTLKNELRHLMWNYAGIIREKQTLQTALNRVKEMLGLPIGKLLRLRLLVSQEIITSALKRKTSLGAHYIKEEVTL